MIANFEEAIEQICSHLSDYLADHGKDPAKNFHCIFPDHHDSTPSCGVVKKNPAVFHCQGCGRSGNIFDAMRLLEDKPQLLGLAWVEHYLKPLAERYDVTLAWGELTEEQTYVLDVRKAYLAAASLIQLHPDSSTLLTEHLKTHKWQEDVLRHLCVGSVKSFSAFISSLIQSYGFTEEFLNEIDLFREDIFNENNLIFTWLDMKGEPIGFSARNLAFESQSSKQPPKYIRQKTTGIKHNLFSPRSRLYNLFFAHKNAKSLYLFEGQGDVITAWHHGIHNCVALSGTSLHDDQLLAIKQLGIFEVILCLDGDATGRQKTKQLIEERLAGHRDLKVKVMELPEDQDPDSYIRSAGIQAFNELARWSAFEWKFNQLDTSMDDVEICQQMVPLIANEPSAIERETLVKQLSLRTGITVGAIQQDLSVLIDQAAYKDAKERQAIVDAIIDRLKKSPGEAELALQEGQHKLFEAQRQRNADALSTEDFLRFIEHQKSTQELSAKDAVGYRLGHDLESFEQTLLGSWKEDVFMLLGGRENSGKSALCAKLAYAIAKHNEDATVIYLTIDDSAAQLLPRMVCIAEGSHELSINMVRHPNYWIEEKGLTWVADKRQVGYERVQQLAQQGRLIIKDMNHGMTLPFIESLITYYQRKYPERHVMFFLDNFHKLSGYEGYKDERVKWKTISQDTKRVVGRRRCAIFATVEYHKMPMGTKPSNYNIGETVQLGYDANYVAHAYNELNDLPHSYNVCHIGKDPQGRIIELPRIELIVTKNKITESKGSQYLNFWPASSDYAGVSTEQALMEAEAKKQERLGDQGDDEDDGHPMNKIYG